LPAGGGAGNRFATILLISVVHPGSPASDAALSRGDKVLAVSGRTIDEIEQSDLWQQVFGEDEQGVGVTLTIEHAAGAVEDIQLTKRWFSNTTTPIVKIVSAGTRPVGYLFFGGFIETSTAELLRAFETFTTNGVEDLILDFRYNGGGGSGPRRYRASTPACSG
jgi:carboxyl-terminal processing protease